MDIAMAIYSLNPLNVKQWKKSLLSLLEIAGLLICVVDNFGLFSSEVRIVL